jgi:hypothetical protein
MHTPPPATPVSPEPAAYRTTWLDRNGPDGGYRLKALGYGLMVFGLSITASFLLMAQGGAHGVGMVVGILAVAAIAGSGVGFLGLRFAQGSGAVMKAFTLPSGNSTPYEEQYSWLEAMIARGDLAGALEGFEAIIAERPDAVAPRLRAAEHYAARNFNPGRAAELFREARNVTAITRRDAIYCTSRLIDLYDGPLNDPGRAMVEMRRVIEQHPDSAVARHARQALAARKAQLTGN